MPRLRRNPLTGDWIILSPERAKRPEEYVRPRQQAISDPADCPFCPTGPAYATKIAETEHTYVIPNRYPAFVPDDQVVSDGGRLAESGLALGRHEVIVRKSHTEHLFDLPPSRLHELLQVSASRLVSAKRDPRLEYGLVFHNHGHEAGSSVAHPHSQMIAAAFVPPRLQNLIREQKMFYAEHQHCLLCRLWQAEAESRVRVLAESQHAIAFLPYASRYPYEIWLVPKRHAAHFEEIAEHELAGVASLLHIVFKTLKSALDDPPINWAVYSKPFRPRIGNEAWHWYLEIMPRLEHFGGFELATGAIINTLSPEHATTYLRSKR